MKKRSKAELDNNTVIVNMNVEGMPWYDEYAPGGPKYNPKKLPGDVPTKGETWQIIKGAVLAGLTVSGIISLGMIIFVLFCVFIWFK